MAVSLSLAAYFTASQPITPRLSVVSSISVIIFAVPSYYALIKARGWKNSVVILGALGAYALILESVALKYGFPYGKFFYSNTLGNKLFGLTPWTVAFAYPPILLLAYWFVRKRNDKFLVVTLGTALAAMICDVVLDPAAVRLGFWRWDNPGFFYGVPLVNFLGWLLSGFIGAVLLYKLYGKSKPVPALAYSGLAILWFWTWVNVWKQQWIPAVLGIFISVYLTQQILRNMVTIKE